MKLPIPTIELFGEDAILSAWPMLTSTELRKARKIGALTFYAFASGPHYTVEDVEAYISEKYRTCRKRTKPLTDGPMAPTTLIAPIPSEAVPGTPAGMTPELAQSTGEAFAQQILSRRSKGRKRVG